MGASYGAVLAAVEEAWSETDRPRPACEETPHEKVISGPGGLSRDEALNAAAKLFPLTRAGQHVYFDVPETRGTEPVYAFAKSQGLKVLDICHVGGRLRVKCVDTP